MKDIWQPVMIICSMLAIIIMAVLVTTPRNRRMRDIHDLVVLVCSSEDSKMRGENCMAMAESDGVVELPEGKRYITVYVPKG